LREILPFLAEALALIEKQDDTSWLRLFLMSCRVMSLGVGTIFLSYLMQTTRDAGRKLRADFRHNGRNRPMFITLKMSNFKAITTNGEEDVILENDLTLIQKLPAYMQVSVPK